ncbi:class I lanthipeptide [Tenacibaculum sp. XPcli2-G]|uniref:class I lanthipeptide n=1 Tax=Tenacibaculum sp. XPcli2-G TaxID=2954503 RepID=UPI0020984532|nr:class I lanthipeptide [Tenacibaculum sp. XPcli2-G]MCO7184270.1 class I lanthipeptide [Tenacibaculum sp. XPcli2-G]
MKKLQLNKKTVAQMDRLEMSSVKGGLCFISCNNGTRKTKNCCGTNRCTKATVRNCPTEPTLQDIEDSGATKLI